MAAAVFHFQRFDVWHDRCGMKVGTDGVLLGAWAGIAHASRLLDVGTGSGLVALMLAQRCEAQIVGLEIDAAAASQAVENAVQSPWSDRIRIEHADFRIFQDAPFDGIVSNPPFFRNSLKAPSDDRRLARHDDSLPYADLAAGSARLLNPGGTLSVILPIDTADAFEDLCWNERLYLRRRCEVISVEGKPASRVLMEFNTERGSTERNTLILETLEHRRTQAFQALTEGFYLNG